MIDHKAQLENLKIIGDFQKLLPNLWYSYSYQWLLWYVSEQFYRVFNSFRAVMVFIIHYVAFS